MWVPVAAFIGGLVLAVVAIVVFAVRMRTKARRVVDDAGGSAEGDRPLDPKVRQVMEDEFRRRKDGSGPTVAGGQHLG